jgi:hypothetical protein
MVGGAAGGIIYVVLKINTHPWSPVIAPKVRVAKRRAVSLGAMKALEGMERREGDLKAANRIRAVRGCAVIAVSVFVVIPILLRQVMRFEAVMHNVVEKDAGEIWQLVMAFDAMLLVFTFPIAVITNRESRSKRINEFLDTGTRATGSNDNPFVRIVLVICMLGLLYGEFLIVDAIGSLWLRFRLRDVDRYRVAVILEMLVAEPRGIDPRLLLRMGENPLHLRHTLGYLMAYEWADISAEGDNLWLLSPAKRELRHAKAGLFEADEPE